MDLRVVVPIQLKLKAFQIEYDNMDEVIDWLNLNYGRATSFERVERFIARLARYGSVIEYMVNGDWIIIDGSTFECISNSDYNHKYREMR